MAKRKPGNRRTKADKRLERLRVVRELSTAAFVGALFLALAFAVPKFMWGNMLKLALFLLASCFLGSVFVIVLKKKKCYGLIGDC